MANKYWLSLLILVTLPLQAKELLLGSSWQLDSNQASSNATQHSQLWWGYERETQVGLLFTNGSSAGLALPLYEKSFIALGVGSMPVVDSTRFSAMWRLGWQLDDDHQLTLSQLVDLTGRYGQLWYMEHSLPLPAGLSLNLWLTRGSQAHMAAYDAHEGWRDWGLTLEHSWAWQKWQLDAEAGAKQWLIKDRDWQPVVNLTLSYRFSW
ncbi:MULTISPECIES: MipA/OmpV family protein [Aeromonas]|uniref:MipA/OmpV family protein n=1 Tax=Aeromonas TaxID=642 RepID=UPI001C21B09D|nr:MipA/OmpV family protein [Aeromonas veronii]QWZ79905.1 MipA/OmpV family protein [Aeromonas sp. FDAARGOS 1414]HDN9005354.1 hypothetical protein [Aeromonas veronii]